MAYGCTKCGKARIKEIDRPRNNVRVYKCQDCGFSWHKVMNYDKDLLRKPYSLFKQGLVDTEKTRELGYKT